MKECQDLSSQLRAKTEDNLENEEKLSNLQKEVVHHYSSFRVLMMSNSFDK